MIPDWDTPKKPQMAVGKCYGNQGGGKANYEGERTTEKVRNYFDDCR